MTATSRWFVKAVYSMDHVVRLVPDDRWDRPSPCEGWTARAVLGHVVAVQSYFTACIDGRPPSMDPYTDPHRHAGPDPAAAWATARDGVLEAVDRPGALDAVVTTFTGDRERAEQVIAVNPLDTAVHGWDLARAAGVDDRLDPGLVRHCLTLVGGLDLDGRPRDPRFYADPLAAPEPDDQATLLAALGRRAD